MLVNYLGHLFRYRRHKITLLPVNYIKVQEGIYESTGEDPQFELASNKKSLPRRWVFISYKIKDLDNILAPTLYYSKGGGYREHAVINLPEKTPEKSCLIKLPYNLESLRLDPADQPGQFELSDVRCVEVGFVPLLLILSWRELEHDLKYPRTFLTKALQGLGFIITKGPVRAREQLLYRHQTCISKRVRYDYTTAQPPVAPEESQWQKLIDAGLSRKARNTNADIIVIVPVYKGYDETLNCIYRVLTEWNKLDFHLVIINDHSPDYQLSSKLRELSEKGLFDLRENKANLGFVRTVNIGMRLGTEQDVVLLNSDTEVYNNWLDRLHAAAYRKEKIGTVTPFSNNAEICSYPYNTHDNNMQLEILYSELDGIASECNKDNYVEIPTGVGFCMYIRRDCLNEVGFFDEESFGKGYGEENDFCLRAAEKGWVNVLSADIFVRHVGGSSFGAEKQERVINAIRIINSRFPGYDRRIQDFLYDDPVLQFRKNIDIARIKRQAKEKVFLFISHNWGGGTEKHIQDMSGHLRNEGVQIYYFRPNPYNSMVANIHCPGIDYLPNLPVLDLLCGAETNAAVLREFGITHVHIHSLAGFNERLITILPEMMRLAGLQYDVTLHDYMTICPRIHLCDDKGRYCNEPHYKVCSACIKRYGTPFGKVEIESWKLRNREILLNARKVFAPNEDVIDRMKHHYPDVQYSLRPHPEEPIDETVFANAVRKPGESIRIGIIGAIGPHKGSYLLQECAKDARERNLPIEFVIMGYTNIPELASEPNVVVTGEYQESRIFGMIKENHIHAAFFPATWPETYSYTLSIAIRAGLKPIAFDLGAIAKRMRLLGYGDLLLPYGYIKSPEAVNDFLLDITQLELKRPDKQSVFSQYSSMMDDYYQLH